MFKAASDVNEWGLSFRLPDFGIPAFSPAIGLRQVAGKPGTGVEVIDYDIKMAIRIREDLCVRQTTRWS
jgi:hypothetical protein